MKIIIGFTNKTGKILPRIFCRRFRHCAIIIRAQIKHKKQYIMIQAGCGKSKLITLKERDLKILEQNGWVFIPYELKKFPSLTRGITCVSFTKRALGIRALFIFTPDQLYKQVGQVCSTGTSV